MKFLLSSMKKSMISFGLIATVLVHSENVTAQETLFEQFLGSWNGVGQLFGAEAQFEMNWQRVLEHQFVRLTFSNNFKDSGGRERILKAQAFYKSTGEGRFRGTWFDSRGMILPLESTFEDSVLTTLWGAAENEEGRTVYRLQPNDRIEVDDYIRKEGKWQKFGHAIYHRADRH